MYSSSRAEDTVIEGAPVAEHDGGVGGCGDGACSGDAGQIQQPHGALARAAPQTYPPAVPLCGTKLAAALCFALKELHRI